MIAYRAISVKIIAANFRYFVGAADPGNIYAGGQSGNVSENLAELPRSVYAEQVVEVITGDHSSAPALKHRVKPFHHRLE